MFRIISRKSLHINIYTDLNTDTIFQYICDVPILAGNFGQRLYCLCSTKNIAVLFKGYIAQPLYELLWVWHMYVAMCKAGAPVLSLNPQSHTSHRGKPPARRVPQFSQAASAVSCPRFSLHTGINCKRRMKQIAQNGTSSPAMLGGSRQLVSVMCFFARPVDARHLTDNTDLVFNFCESLQKQKWQ